MKLIAAGLLANIALIVGGPAVSAWFAALPPLAALLLTLALALAVLVATFAPVWWRLTAVDA